MIKKLPVLTFEQIFSSYFHSFFKKYIYIYIYINVVFVSTKQGHLLNGLGERNFCCLLSCSECFWGPTCSTGVQGCRCQEVQIHPPSLQYIQSRLGLADSACHILRCCDSAL